MNPRLAYYCAILGLGLCLYPLPPRNIVLGVFFFFVGTVAQHFHARKVVFTKAYIQGAVEMKEAITVYGLDGLKAGLQKELHGKGKKDSIGDK